MVAILEIYNTRKQEIDSFIELIKFLEIKKRNRDDEDSEFDKFFYCEDGINLTYQSFTNILKSNVSLMIYNLIEFTITNLIERIYDEIRRNRLSYTDVNEFIKNLWTTTILKSTNDPNASHSTFVKKSEYLINKIVNSSTIELKSRDTLPAGNLDGEKICDTLKKHGIGMRTSSTNYRPDILKKVREKRNDLAHGTVSFVEALRDDSISDIESNKVFITNFLEEIIDNVSQYIENEYYKTS